MIPFPRLDQLINSNIAAGFPGAVVVVSQNQQIIKSTAYGFAKQSDANIAHCPTDPLHIHTLFDLASNSKMYATNYAIQYLYDRHQLDIDAPLTQYFPQFKNSPNDTIGDKALITVTDLLSHCAGFPADPQYHRPDIAGHLYCQDREQMLDKLCQTPLAYPPKQAALYSDVDYLLLGLLVEQITHQRLDQFMDQHFYHPLQLKRTCFNPLQQGFTQTDCAATEIFGNTRDGHIHFPHIRIHTLQGEVQDEKCFYSMAGVAGHAGLFSSADEVAILMRIMENGGHLLGHYFFSPATIARFLQPLPQHVSFGLGWRLHTDASLDWMCSPFASSKAYGHTGWTGTCTLIDPYYDLSVVILTNRKHTAVLDATNDPNRFVGDTYAIARYGTLHAAIYQDLAAASLLKQRPISP